jgi:hypothetical protein
MSPYLIDSMPNIVLDSRKGLMYIIDMEDTTMTVEELIVKRETVSTMTDADLVEFAAIERNETGSNSDYVTEEFEKRMAQYGCPFKRLVATQIDYIAPSETIKQFAERIRDDQEF